MLQAFDLHVNRVCGYKSNGESIRAPMLAASVPREQDGALKCKM
jgi:hypothetical protein